MAELASPNILNYALLKGNVYFTQVGGSRRHLGNCILFDTEPSVEKLDHFSSMVGVKTKDQSVVLSKTLTLTLTLEEITLSNLRIALFGGPVTAGDTTDGAGNDGFDIFAVSEVRGVLEIEGSNDVGPKYSARFPNVTFTPNGATSLMGGDDWANIPLTGEALAVNGVPGRMWLQDSETTTA